MSILSTCCYTAEQVSQLHKVLSKWDWESFEIWFSDVGCNIDKHEPNMVYLHAMPDQQSQKRLQDFTEKINEQIESQGFSVQHAPKSRFHMTLARVSRDYPADQAVAAAKRLVFGDAGLRLQLCRLTLDGQDYSSLNAAELNCSV